MDHLEIPVEKHLLLAKDLWKYVDGSAVLAEGATAEQGAKHRSESQKAFSVIAMSVSTSQLYLITSYEEPKEAWDALKKHFERETLANKLFLKKQYFRKEMSEGNSIDMHLKEMKELTDKLSSIGAPISEEDQIVTLLGSLPPSFSTVVTALEARVDDLKMDFVQQQLIHNERKLKAQESKPEALHDSALVGAQKRKPPRCWTCDEVGHIQRFCPKRKDKSQHRAKITEDEIESDSNGEGAFPVSDEVPEDKWLVDSGASSHMTPKREYFTKYRSFSTPEKVGLGDGRVVDAVGVGTIRLNMLFKVSNSKRAVMYDVLHVPKLTCNLFSVRATAKRGYSVKFGQSRCWIRGPKGALEGMGSLAGKLYHLKCEVITGKEKASMVSEDLPEVDLWHQRLGHLNRQQLNTLVDRDLASGIKLSTTSKLSFCEGCVEGKMQRKPFKPLTHQQSKKKLELVHSDVCGPLQAESIGGSRYFVTFIDDYSRCVSVYFIKHKTEVFEKFKLFEAMVTKECGEPIMKLRTDNGGEYMSKDFQAYLTSKGIEHQLTIPHSPQQNGVAERLNRTLMQSAKAMLSHSNLPNKFWAEAVATAAYLRNRTTTSANEEQLTPFEKWYGHKPNISHLRVFGCAAYSHVPSTERRKLDKKAQRMCFIGYNKNPKGYRLINLSTDKAVTRRDVVFNETDFRFFKRTNDESVSISPELLNESEDETTEGEPQPEESPRRSQRAAQRPDYYGYSECADTAKQVEHCAYSVQEIPEPGTFDEEIYMQQPDGYQISRKENLVCRLKKSLYGLKQAPRCWNRALKEFMIQAGFVQSNADPCVFIRLDEHTTILAVYVDDLILIADVIEVMLETKRLLSERFRMKDMGQLHYCLGVNIVYGPNCVWLHQKQYITLMLRKFGLADANTVSTPADCNVKLVKDDHVSKFTDQGEYQSMVGSLLYIAMGTRPDIAQAVGVVSKFCSNPTEAHKTAVKRIFHYLKKTINLALKYCKVKNQLLDSPVLTGEETWMTDTRLLEMCLYLLVGQ